MLPGALVPLLASGQSGIGGHAMIAAFALPRFTLEASGHGIGRQRIAIPPDAPVLPAMGGAQGSGRQIKSPLAPLLPVDCGAL